MNETTSGTLETHQDVYEWWRNKKDEIVNSIDELKGSTDIDPKTLEILRDMVQGARVRKKTMEEYFEED